MHEYVESAGRCSYTWYASFLPTQAVQTFFFESKRLSFRPNQELLGWVGLLERELPRLHV